MRKLRISANSFRGNYCFLNLALCTVTYSREETIQGQKLFAEIRYMKISTFSFFKKEQFPRKLLAKIGYAQSVKFALTVISKEKNSESVLNYLEEFVSFTKLKLDKYLLTACCMRRPNIFQSIFPALLSSYFECLRNPAKSLVLKILRLPRRVSAFSLIFRTQLKTIFESKQASCGL